MPGLGPPLPPELTAWLTNLTKEHHLIVLALCMYITIRIVMPRATGCARRLLHVGAWLGLMFLLGMIGLPLLLVAAACVAVARRVCRQDRRSSASKLSTPDTGSQS